ncbi:hypothetical protein D3260_08125 [Salinisphaera sp. Q1T1-3]|nr:hypothetical protein D3260_08125 [Salinisphaera sp. Q1T1-3]
MTDSASPRAKRPAWFSTNRPGLQRTASSARHGDDAIALSEPTRSAAGLTIRSAAREHHRRRCLSIY